MLSITHDELKDILVSLSGYDDFKLEVLEEYREEEYGNYYQGRKRIEIYALDENGKSYDKDELIKTGIHELTHHILINHSDYSSNDYHDDTFKKLFAKLLKKYYNNNIPKNLIKEIKEEGLYYGS